MRFFNCVRLCLFVQNAPLAVVATTGLCLQTVASQDNAIREIWGGTIMSQQARDRLKVIEGVLTGQMRQVEADRLLDFIVRKGRRIQWRILLPAR